MKPDIEIKCPNCQSKANFYADGTTGEYVLKPSHIGKMSCVKCGMNKKIEIKTEMYFYQIPVDNRILYARTFDNLLILRKYFAENMKMYSDPELDFPKSFYKKRKEIVQLIDKRIKPAGNNGYS
ncbi:hypothetical protein Fleli_2350 [Bernardetia litoralis DSM 6794]|uniref:CpXC domain-containing protein n=1 Tax=Bernardetia litoralis (strain ATCC 23117 / DSM 6794 / NBRC 15988 / NCIMB 1366 / Fx l1 / Sio-4) TaxID=880071 RepID=I4AL87_BERLS|nr:hypothetical protein [Bernardetia litoralis]AFM04722.1 hypothetical protein Fleli_2350 [Bernardetia litoralis DSM 6794]